MASNGADVGVLGLMQLMRLENCIPAASYVLVGAYLGGGWQSLATTEVARAALLVLLLVAFAFTINDYCDAPADQLSKPERPIPAGRASRRAAGLLGLALIPAALAVALTLNLWIVLLGLGCLALSAVYSYRLKTTVLLGNATVALLGASVPFFGALAIAVPTPAVWIAGSLTFLYLLAQEVLYTLEDVKGDRCAGLCTTATWLGEIPTLRLYQALALVFVAASPLPWIIGVASDRYLYALLPCTVLPTLAVVIALAVRFTDSVMRLAVNGVWCVWFSSLLPIVLLR